MPRGDVPAPSFSRSLSSPLDVTYKLGREGKHQLLTYIVLSLSLSLSLCVSLSVFVSLSLSVSVSACLSVSLSLSLSLCVFLCLCLSARLSLSHCLSLSLCLCLSVCISVSVSLSLGWALIKRQLSVNQLISHVNRVNSKTQAPFQYREIVIRLVVKTYLGPSTPAFFTCEKE